MNYILEINAFERRMRRSPLPTTAQLLWYKLMHFSNTLHWPGWFSIDNERLLKLMNITGELTLRTARKALEDEGYILFERGAKGRPSRYKLISVADIERVERQPLDTGDSEPEGDFLTEAENITGYFGYTEALGLELKRITQKLFETYLPQTKPAEQDERRVFFFIKEQTEDPPGQWTMTFPKESKELLAYAFEQAQAANAVNWNYISGIYRNFQQRGIKTVDQAIGYEVDRDQRKGHW